MTDLEELKALLGKWGVGFTEGTAILGSVPGGPAGVVVELAANKGGVEGYGGFCTEFHFGADGSFAQVGIWE